MGKLNEEEYIKQMKEECFDTLWGPHKVNLFSAENHENADRILEDFVYQLGYDKLAKLYHSVKKWYYENRDGWIS